MLDCNPIIALPYAYDRPVGLDSLPNDLDATRQTVAARDLIATASAYLTSDIALSLPFEALVPFKALLRRFFSTQAWTRQDAQALSDAVAPHVTEGWWEHDLGGGITLAYGIRGDRFELWTGGAGTAAPSIFDRVFDGPIVPEATPHPRKVKFATGGIPAPGIWYRRRDHGTPDDPRVERLFAEPDVTDVMVAGDFVTIGIGARSSWENRLEPILALVTELFAAAAAEQHRPARTREELMQEAGRSSSGSRPEELHLLDPDEGADRQTLQEALEADDPRVRRIAVAVLLESSDSGVRHGAVTSGIGDRSRLVRRTAVDAAADTEDEHFRPLFETLLADDDAWIRWKAVRSLGDLGLNPSRSLVEALADDPDFQVQFEVAKVLREGSQR
jgi:hypothetical protein